MSNRAHAVAIISIAQHARPIGIGQSEFFLIQLIAASRRVKTTLPSIFESYAPCASVVRSPELTSRDGNPPLPGLKPRCRDFSATPAPPSGPAGRQLQAPDANNVRAGRPGVGGMNCLGEVAAEN